MISVTPGAARQIQAATLQSSGEGLGLRIAAKIVEDGSIQYGMGFDDQRDDDLVITSEGVLIFVAPMSEAILNDTVMDFVEISPGEFHFVFINPNEVELLPQSTDSVG